MNLGVRFVPSSPGALPSLDSTDIVPTSGQSFAAMAGGASAWIVFDRPVSYISVDMVILSPASAPTLSLGAVDVSRGVAVFQSTVSLGRTRVWTQMSMPSAPTGYDATRIELYAYDLRDGFASPVTFGFDSMQFEFVPEPSVWSLAFVALVTFAVVTWYKKSAVSDGAKR